MLCQHCSCDLKDEKWTCGKADGKPVIPQMCDDMDINTGESLGVRPCFERMATLYVSVTQKGWMCQPCLIQRELRYSDTPLVDWCGGCEHS